MGKLLTLKDDNFVVYADKDIEKIDTAMIISILDPSSYLYREYKESNEIGRNRTYYYLGAGYAISKQVDNINRRCDNGFDINASILYTYSKYFGIRTDFDFYHFDKKEYTYSYNYPGYSGSQSYSGGATNSVLVRLNLTFGSLNPNDPLQFYFIPALGTGITFNKSGKYIYVYNNNPSVTSTFGSNTVHFAIGVSLGLGLNVKFTDKIRGFAEYQYNVWNLGTYGPPYFSTIKFGVIL